MKSTMSVELKYCERCGGLWLRECGSDQVYCVRCLTLLDDWPSSPNRQVVRLPIAPSVTLDDIDFEIHINDVEDIDGMAWFAPGGAA